jgi:hypothetical protein
MLGGAEATGRETQIKGRSPAIELIEVEFSEA